jgi:hypothetical protein
VGAKPCCCTIQRSVVRTTGCAAQTCPLNSSVRSVDVVAVSHGCCAHVSRLGHVAELHVRLSSLKRMVQQESLLMEGPFQRNVPGTTVPLHCKYRCQAG